MGEVDLGKLDEMAKTKYGKYKISEGNKFLNFLFNVFIKANPQRAFIHGLILAGTGSYWYFTKDGLPLLIFFIYLASLNVFGIIYWQFEEKRLNKEISRTEKELLSIQKEMQERQKYFMDLKQKIDEENSKNKSA